MNSSKEVPMSTSMGVTGTSKTAIYHDFVLQLVTITSAFGIAFIQFASIFVRYELLQDDEAQCHKTLVDVLVQQGIRVYLFLFSIVIILVELHWKTFIIQQSLLFCSKIARGVFHIFVALVVIDQKVILHFQTRALTVRGVTLGCMLMICGMWYVACARQSPHENSIPNKSTLTTKPVDTMQSVVDRMTVTENFINLQVSHTKQFAEVDMLPSRQAQELTQAQEQPQTQAQAQAEEQDHTLELSILHKNEVIKHIESVALSISHSLSLSCEIPVSHIILQHIHNPPKEDSTPSRQHTDEQMQHSACSTTVRSALPSPVPSPSRHHPLRVLVITRENADCVDSDDESDYDEDLEHPTQTQTKSYVVSQIENMIHLVEYTVEGAINQAEKRIMEVELLLHTHIGGLLSGDESRMENVQNVVELLVEGAICRAEMRVEQLSFLHKQMVDQSSNSSSGSSKHNNSSISNTNNIDNSSKLAEEVIRIPAEEMEKQDEIVEEINIASKGGRNYHDNSSILNMKSAIIASSSIRQRSSAMTSSTGNTATAPLDESTSSTNTPRQTVALLRDSEIISKQSAAQQMEEQQLQLCTLLASTTKSGWLHKCGHVRKNWTKRWFVLEKGVLRYYKSALTEAPYGKRLKGEIHLDHFVAELVASGDDRLSLATKGEAKEAPTEGDTDTCRFHIYNILEYKKEQKVPRRTNIFRKQEHFLLEIKAVTQDCAQEWISAINGHIEYFYKSKFDGLQQEDILSEGWLEKKNVLSKKWHKRWFVLKTNKIGK